MGIVFECLDKLHLISDHCGIKQCFKNSVSVCLLLLNWKKSLVPTALLGMRVELGAQCFSCLKWRLFLGRCIRRSHGAQEADGVLRPTVPH